MSADGEGQSQRRVAALKERRNELGCSQIDVATELAHRSDGYFDGVARGTIGHYVSQWEQGKTEPAEETLDKYEAALDAIEAEQNREEPDCVNPDCDTTSDYPRVETDGGPLCQVCYYTRDVEPLNSADHGGEQ